MREALREEEQEKQNEKQNKKKRKREETAPNEPNESRADKEMRQNAQPPQTKSQPEPSRIVEEIFKSENAGHLDAKSVGRSKIMRVYVCRQKITKNVVE